MLASQFVLPTHIHFDATGICVTQGVPCNLSLTEALTHVPPLEATSPLGHTALGGGGGGGRKDSRTSSMGKKDTGPCPCFSMIQWVGVRGGAFHDIQVVVDKPSNVLCSLCIL